MLASRRRFIKGIVGLTSAPIIGCSKGRPPLNIASHVWPGYEFMFLAKNMGWLADTNIQFHETESATESIQKLQLGLVDGAALTLDEVIRVKSEGTDLSIVTIFNVSAGADKLLARGNINNLSDLKGKTIGVETSALGALMLHKILNRAKLSPSDVNISHIEINDHVQAWKDTNVDAVITYEPHANIISQIEDTKTIFDSREIPKTIFDVLAVTPKLASYQEQALMTLIKGHFAGRSHFQTNTQDAVQRLANRLQINSEQVVETYRGLRLPTLRENHKLLSGPQNQVTEVASSLMKIMFEKNIIQREIDTTNLTTPLFLPHVS